jgi:hypothetical protein
LLLKQSRGIITSLSKLLEPNAKYLVAFLYILVKQMLLLQMKAIL